MCMQCQLSFWPLGDNDPPTSPHGVEDGLIWQPPTALPLGNLVGEVVEGYAVHAAGARPGLHLPPSEVGEDCDPHHLWVLAQIIFDRFHLDRYAYDNVRIDQSETLFVPVVILRSGTAIHLRMDVIYSTSS